MPKDKLSVIVPVKNEWQSIEPLTSRLLSTLKRMNMPYEVIYVDDGSTDSTWHQIRQVSTKQVRAIRLQKNYGKSMALKAGITHAKGTWILTMDGDLQDQPEEIPRFWEKHNTYDLIVGWKYRRHDPWHKTIPSLFFNWLTRKLTGAPVHDSNSGMKLMSMKAANSLWLYGELHRYIPAIAHWQGYRITEIKVKHTSRKYGRSKYGVTRLMWGFLDLITVKFLMTYGRRPLHLFGLVGALFGFFGFLIGLRLSWDWLNGIAIGNRPLLMLAVLLVVLGVQFFSLGLLGELIIVRKREDIHYKETLL